MTSKPLPCNPAFNLVLGKTPDATTATLAFDDSGITVSFTFDQKTIRSPRDIFQEDSLRVSLESLKGNDPKSEVEFILSPYQECRLTSRQPVLVITESCSGTITEPFSRAGRWGGKLQISYDTLSHFRLSDDIDATIGRVEFENGCTVAQPPCPLRASSAHVVVHVDRTAAKVVHDRYIAGGPDLGNPPSGTPRHRAVGTVYAPVGTGTLLSTTFSDDAGPLLNIRKQAAQSVLGADHAKAFACKSCGSFFVSDPQPFGQSIASSNVVGIQLSGLGVDRAPFDPAAVSYPIDAGYKLIGADRDGITAAFFEGTAGVAAARDSVAGYTRQFTTENSLLRLSVQQVSANRSQPAPAPSKTPFYAGTSSTALRTEDTQITAAYNVVPPKPDDGSPFRNIGVLVRYATQYQRFGSTLDIAVSDQRDPPFLNLVSKPAEPAASPRLRGHFSTTLGYRNAGRAYAPLDTSFDLFTGLHGFYGLLEYSGLQATRRPYDFTLAAYQFSDALERRNETVSLTLKQPLWPALTLLADVGASQLTISQAARASKFIVPDDLGGSHYLPNGHGTMTLTYTSPYDFTASLGYGRADSQSCNKSLKRDPCYPYANPSATGTIAWKPGTDLFVDASVKNSSSELLSSGFGDVAAMLPGISTPTSTLSHTEYAYGIGANVFRKAGKGCSTILLTSTNRSGVLDFIANTSDQPRFAQTASYEYVPTAAWPTALIAFSRVGFIDRTVPTKTLFIARLQYAVEPGPWRANVFHGCS
ncbi:MAG TPA: hypothetical protein VK669_08815 [Candidatus Limnocylindrales bacterium]|nr:hypothetical protein [Candidatus Limnocylindrales bacterium]